MTYIPAPNKTLTIYKASAGSGKTFRLAVEYIKLLLANPKAYEGILAVTFTNKATEEMKMRILSQLYGIWKQLPESAAYIKEVTTSLGISEMNAAQRAEKALRQLLHNYHFFKVQTIDAFFQTVLRNLANELQLNANLRVGLNNEQVVEQAVDTLIDSLADDRLLMNIVMDYIKDNIQEDRVWNVIGQIKKFGSTIFSELYKQHRSQMDSAFASQDFFDNYKKALYAITSNTEKKYKSYGNKALEYITAAGLATDDFASKTRGPVGYFIKLAAGQLQDKDLLTKTFEAAIHDVNKWVTKTSGKKDIIIPFVEEVLLPMINDIENKRSIDICSHNSAKVTLKHINDVRLLRKIEDIAHSLNNTAQRFMLSDTQSLLHEIIDDGDSSFIFEKIGARLEHMMIDEFQDTSTIQWENFKPLLRECMSQGCGNLIVGDVKQSIYRFRNGDWRLLNDIDKIFSKEELEFPPMRTNWRSDKNIVSFNNTFFNIAADIEVNSIREYSEEKADSLQKAYADVAQNIPEGKEAIGLVNLMMLPKDQLDTMQERTLQTILDLIDLGAKQKDIAILVRDSKNLTTLAQYIENNSDIKIVSAEAFRLDASVAVRIIVNAMILLAHPQDDIALAALATDYHTLASNDKKKLEKAFSCGCDLRTILPQEYTDNSTVLISMSLHNMAEEIVRIFGIDKQESETAYVTAFFDCLQNFCNDMAPVLEDFISAWNEELYKSTIQAADSNGVRILTIHKSKGLEFRHVIIPYCNWGCNPPKPLPIWTQPKVKPFSDLPFIPVDYLNVNTLEYTIYKEDGYNEHIQNVVDNLNLLYVAMTRAGHSLFIIGERYDSKSKTWKRSEVIDKVIKQLPDSINGVEVHISGIDNEEEPLSVTYGTIVEKKESKENKTDTKGNINVFTPQILPCNARIHSYCCNVEFRQSNASRRFADDTIDETDRQRMIRMGTVMHQLFSTIHTLEDIDTALQRMEFDGTLYGEDITREELTASIKRKFANEQVREWFSDHWTVYNECSIISPDGSEHRPDRVITDGKETIVIDFKFGNASNRHREQVTEYIQLLNAMGMPNVKGYIWYVTSEQIQDI